MKTLALCFALLLGATAVQDVPTPAQAGKPHAWLQQLVGEWSVTSEATMGPDVEAIQMEFTETVRSVGDLWILAEGRADFMGTPVHTVLTLGYDPAQEAFVGTWIDSMQTHMYVYKGALDESGKVLTLETTGPSMDDPSQTVAYRDVLQIVDEDHKVLTSSVQEADGAWNKFMRADYRRK